MRIGIITFTYGDNFGQRLQNFALQEYLKKYADYVLTIPQYKAPESIQIVLRKAKHAIQKPVDEYLECRRHRKFAGFDHRNICYYPGEIAEGKIPKNINDEFDYFICGSDQIWSPYSPFVDGSMFLTFADKRKRISYAASLAVNEIPEAKKNLFVSYWRGFNEISIREDNLRGYIEKASGVKTYTHIDPTLLHDSNFWNCLSRVPKRPPYRKYIFSYFLGDAKQQKEYMEKFNSAGLDVINIMSDKRYYAISPDEFIWLIKNAEFVCTDSYHGTIFSIIFHKPFVIAMRDGAKVDMNSRFETLSRQLSFGERRADMVEADRLYDIDFELIDSAIRRERERTRLYFDNTIRG